MYPWDLPSGTSPDASASVILRTIFLANCGLSNAELARKPYGHDLLKLYAEARARGLKVSIHKAAELLEWVNEYHDQGALLRYDFTETRELPSCSTLFPIVKEILAASEA